MGNKKRKSLETITSAEDSFNKHLEELQDVYPLWINGTTVTPNGNRETTYEDWQWANAYNDLKEREANAAESVRHAIDKKGTPIVAGIYGLAAAPFAIQGLGSSAVSNGIRTGLKATETAFTPSTWLNPVTSTKLLSPTIGTIADAGVQGTFAYEGLNGLYNQGKQGTLLSDPTNTFTHSLEVLPLINFGNKAISSIYRNFTNSIAKNRKLPVNITNRSVLNTRKDLEDFWYKIIGPKIGNSMDRFYTYLENNPSYGRSKLREYLFGTNYIPYSYKINDAHERITGGAKYTQNFVNIPEEDVYYMISNTIGRNDYEKFKAGYSEEAIKQEALKQVNVLRDYTKIAEHSTRDYVDAGYPNAVGIHTKKGNTHYISIKRGSRDQKRTKYHEYRHALQDIYTRTEEQNNILYDAYGDDFLNLEKYKRYDMTREAETTNLESRDILMNRFFYYTDDIFKQNDFIDKANDYQIFKAVEESNAYGYNYIKYLRKHNLLTPEKAQAFREAMKHVGSYVLGAGTAGIVADKYLNQDKNANQQYRNGGKISLETI